MDPEAGLDPCLVGRGVVVESSAGDGGEDAACLKGTVFAVRDFIKDGRNAFFSSFFVGGGVSAEAGAETWALFASGVVFGPGVFTNDARDTFFVLWRGDVVTGEEADCPVGKGAAGAVGPIGAFLCARALGSDDGGSQADSCRLVGRCVTPGGVDGARFGAWTSSAGTASGGMSVGGGRLANTSLNGAQSSIPSCLASSVSDNSPSKRCCRTCSSE